MLEEQVPLDELADREDWWMHQQHALRSMEKGGLNRTRSGGVLSQALRGLNHYRGKVLGDVTGFRVKVEPDEVDHLQSVCFHLNLYEGHPSYRRCHDSNMVVLFDTLANVAQVETAAAKCVEDTLADLLFLDEALLFDWVLERLARAYTRYARFASPGERDVAYRWQSGHAALRD